MEKHSFPCNPILWSNQHSRLNWWNLDFNCPKAIDIQVNMQLTRLNIWLVTKSKLMLHTKKIHYSKQSLEQWIQLVWILVVVSSPILNSNPATTIHNSNVCTFTTDHTTFCWREGAFSKVEARDDEQRLVFGHRMHWTVVKSKNTCSTSEACFIRFPDWNVAFGCYDGVWTSITRK